MVIKDMYFAYMSLVAWLSAGVITMITWDCEKSAIAKIIITRGD